MEKQKRKFLFWETIRNKHYFWFTNQADLTFGWVNKWIFEITLKIHPIGN
jgi:hypothetical protein